MCSASWGRRRSLLLKDAKAYDAMVRFRSSISKCECSAGVVAIKRCEGISPSHDTKNNAKEYVVSLHTRTLSCNPWTDPYYYFVTSPYTLLSLFFNLQLPQ